MSLKNSLFSAKGRISRTTFWGHIIGIQVFIFAAVLPMVARSVIIENGKSTGGIIENLLFLYSAIILPIISIITFIADMNIGIKRFHDRNKSGWFMLLSFVPFVNLSVLLELGFLKGTIGENQYGPDPITNIDEVQAI